MNGSIPWTTIYKFGRINNIDDIELLIHGIRSIERAIREEESGSKE